MRPQPASSRGFSGRRAPRHPHSPRARALRPALLAEGSAADRVRCAGGRPSPPSSVVLRGPSLPVPMALVWSDRARGTSFLLLNHPGNLTYLSVCGNDQTQLGNVSPAAMITAQLPDPRIPSHFSLFSLKGITHTRVFAFTDFLHYCIKWAIKRRPSDKGLGFIPQNSLLWANWVKQGRILFPVGAGAVR